MALNASGAISLAGSTAGESIALELGESATATTTLNDSAVRTLADVSDGAIVMPTDFYGKATIVDAKQFAWGSGSQGKLGQGNTTTYSSPVQIGSLTDWAVVSAGRDFTMFVKNDGTLWSVGYNYWGALGQGTAGDSGENLNGTKSSPAQIGSLTTWEKVAAGHHFAVALKTDGTIWSWGRNVYGQLGHGDTSNLSSPVQVGGLTTWKEIAVGQYYTLAVKTDGTLWSWGRNNTGSAPYGGFLGDGTTTTRSSPVQVGSLTDWDTVECGPEISMAIKTNGTLWAWGVNGAGNLGDGSTSQRKSPVQIGALTTWAKVAPASHHTLAVKTDGTLWAWGTHSPHGELGTGATYGGNRSSPVQVGALTTWSKVAVANNWSHAIKTDGTLWAWGKNDTGQLGLGSTTYYSSPVQVGSLTTWLNISSGEEHTLGSIEA